MSRRAGAITVALAAVALALAAPAGAAGLTLTVRSVPTLEGLDFEFGGQRYTTSEDGVVSIPVAGPGTYRLVALPWRHLDRGIRVHFSRWGDDSFRRSRTVTVDRSKTVEVGYEVSYLRGVSFFDCLYADLSTGCEDGATRPVAPKRVTSVTLANTLGQKIPLGPRERVWLEGVRVARRLHGLEETILIYSVMHVRVEGSDVVNQAQQRFYLAKPSDPKRTPIGRLRYAAKTFRIRLSLYDAFFSTHDLLFRSPVGKALQLTYPNGRKRDYDLTDGKLQLRSMPRGLYQVKVKTGAGIQMEVPVSLSKNQRMQLKVISYADIMGSFAVFALVSIVLVTARRPALRAAMRRQLARLRRRRKAIEVGQ